MCFLQFFSNSYNKENGRSNISWNLEASDIQLNLARWQLSRVRETLSNPFCSFPESSKHNITSIIRPFQINGAGGTQDRELVTEITSGESLTYKGSVRFVDISISTIALNLVDAEVLARVVCTPRHSHPLKILCFMCIHL